jgi:hypothetical protein
MGWATFWTKKLNWSLCVLFNCSVCLRHSEAVITFAVKMQITLSFEILFLMYVERCLKISEAILISMPLHFRCIS